MMEKRALQTIGLLLGVIALLFAAEARGVTLHVPGEYSTVASGLAAAGHGDTVLVACGVYEECGLVMPSGVTLRSENGDPGCVTLDAQGQGRVILCSGVDTSTRIEGVTITGGWAAGEPETTWGAGMLCIDGAEPVVADCVFFRNQAIRGYGGGLACVNSSPTVERCAFTENRATSEGSGGYGQGGGVKALSSAATLRDCTFQANVAQNDGGGVRCDYSPLSISGCQFLANSVSRGGGGLSCLCSSPTVSGCVVAGNVAGAWGGGISCLWWSSPAITETKISDNQAMEGGGIFCRDSSSPVVTGCLISGNGAGFGGGICARYSSGPVITSSVFSRNSVSSNGGAVICDHASTVQLRNCTLVHNRAAGFGSALYLSDPPVVIDRSIVAFNTGLSTIVCYADPGNVAVSCTDIFGNEVGDWEGCIASQFGVNGNFSADPLFCGAEAGDFHLDCRSPCAPAQQPECGLIGACDVGCGASATEAATWGALKSLFRPGP